MRHLPVLIVIFFFSCDAENTSRKKIASLQNADQNQKYQVGMACMQYISRYGEDLAYSKTLVKKLIEIGFFAEAIYAVELLLEKFPGDPELFYLRGTAYRNQHQYDFALKDLNHALKLQPANNTFSTGLRSAQEELVTWNEIQSLNETLTTSADSFDVLFQRAEKFLAIRQYDAVLFDLGAISKMRTTADSIYFNQKVSELYKDTQRPVEKLSEMLEYFRGLKGTK
ncbi:MAG: tetratricopeptide repeat protein [Cyclobacteriaceae bacterium]